MRTAALVIVLVLLAAAFAATLTRTPYLIGDGREYACVARSWLANGVPYAPLEFFEDCSNSLGASTFVGFKQVNGTAEPFHFWLLSLLAAPLWPLAGLHAFTVVHALLAAAVVWWLFRSLPVAVAVTVVAIIAASPLVYWADKAHSEFFICALLTAAFASVTKGDLVVASVPVAIAATQQSTLSIPAVLLLGAGLLRCRDWRPAAATLAFLALPAAYYTARIGQPSLLLGMQNWGAIGFHRASSLFVDPDIGLLPSWPLGVLLILLSLASLAVRRVRLLVAVAAAFCAVEAALVSMQTNWNSGGTVTILRYATYFIPPLAVCGAMALFAGTERWPPRMQTGLVAVTLVLLAWYHVRWNDPVFHPYQPESYTGRTPFSNWLYTHHPSWYDPDPEVFVERSYYVDGVERVPADAWAAGNFACTKLYILKPVEQLRRMPNPPANPMHCLLPNDSADVFQALVDGRIRPNARGYINRN